MLFGLPHSVKKKKPTILLLLTEDNIGSTILLARLHRYKDISIVGVVKSPGMRGGYEASRKYIKRVGFFYSAAFTMQFAATRFMLWLRGKNLQRLTHNIPIHVTENINSKTSQAFIKDVAPDYIVSAFFNQILKPEVLELAKKESINLHPADINRYRGAMNYFWVMHNEEHETGITLHKMDAGIDTGNIIAIRPFRIHPQDTQFTIHVKTAFIGAKLLRRYLTGTLQPSRIKQTKGNYYSVPDKRRIEKYYRRRPIFRFRQIAATIRKLVQ